MKVWPLNLWSSALIRRARAGSRRVWPGTAESKPDVRLYSSSQAARLDLLSFVQIRQSTDVREIGLSLTSFFGTRTPSEDMPGRLDSYPDKGAEWSGPK